MFSSAYDCSDISINHSAYIRYTLTAGLQSVIYSPEIILATTYQRAISTVYIICTDQRYRYGFCYGQFHLQGILHFGTVHLSSHNREKGLILQGYKYMQQALYSSTSVLSSIPVMDIGFLVLELRVCTSKLTVCLMVLGAYIPTIY